MPKSLEPIIEVNNLTVSVEQRSILNGLSLTVNQGEILGIVGGSGAGKTTLLRGILLLLPAAGSIKIYDKEILKGNYKNQAWARTQWGVMFQYGALFSSLTVLENVAFPLREFTKLDNSTIIDIARLKISMVGLKREACYNYPAELSGGMKKRTAVARALALDPKLLFLDEPTAGLDPHSASAFDELILQLKQNLDLTVVMVTHDLDTLWRVTDRVAFLGAGKVLEVASMKMLSQSNNLIVKEYFSDVRAKARLQSNAGNKSDT